MLDDKTQSPTKVNVKGHNLCNVKCDICQSRVEVQGCRVKVMMCVKYGICAHQWEMASQVEGHGLDQ